MDWTKQLGFEYYLVDEGWRSWKDDGKDNWACLREVCDYAKTQGVKIWLWVNSNEVPNARDAHQSSRPRSRRGRGRGEN